MASEEKIDAYKRVNHFHGQFLNADDFNEAHEYHYKMRRRLNYGLYPYGVIDGLDFDETTTGTTIRVTAGMALDRDETSKQSREIVLLQNYSKDLVNNLGYQSGDGANPGDTVYVTISYAGPEKEDDFEDVAGFSGPSRITEQAVIKTWLDTGSGPPGSRGTDILLGKVTIDADNTLIYDRTEREIGGINALLPGPALSMSQTNLIFTVEAGVTMPQNILITNIGSGELIWIATPGGPDADKFVLSATGGTAPSWLGIEVSSPGVLDVGTYHAWLVIESAEANNSPKVIMLSAVVTQTPFLAISSPNLQFAIERGSSTPVGQTFSITNAGSGTLGWGVIIEGPDAERFSLSAMSGTAPSSITVSVNDPGGLAVDTYRASIRIESEEASNAPQTVALSAVVTEQPILEISPSTINFEIERGASAPVAQTISIANAVSGTLNWTATLAGPDAERFSLSTFSGTTPVTIAVSVNEPGTLEVTTYQASIRIASSEAGNSPQVVNVRLHVIALPVLAVNPATMNFSASVGGSNPRSQVLSIKNVGSGQLRWIATSTVAPGTPSWLSLSARSGVAPSTIAVSVNIKDLKVGDYRGIIRIDSEAENSPQTVTVTLRISSTFTVTIITPTRPTVIAPTRPTATIITPTWPTVIAPTRPTATIIAPTLTMTRPTAPIIAPIPTATILSPTVPIITRPPVIGPREIRSLQEIRGIGPATEKKFNDAGINTIEELASASPEHVAEILEIRDITKAEQFIKEAKLLMEQP